MTGDTGCCNPRAPYEAGVVVNGQGSSFLQGGQVRPPVAVPRLSLPLSDRKDAFLTLFQ